MHTISSLSPHMKILLTLWWGLLAVFLVLTAAIFVLSRQEEQVSDIATANIVLHVTGELTDLKLHFGVLHVRDGKDEVPDHGKLLNEEIPFDAIDRHGTLSAAIQYDKHLGFQFKCFVDYSGHEYAKIKQLIEIDNRFRDVSKGGGAEQRIWFILEEYPTTKTVDGFVNNYFYPS